MEKARIIVGTNRLEYPQQRNFAGLPLQRYEVRRVRDWNKIPVWFSYKLRNHIPLRLENTFRPMGDGTALHHLFNALSTGRKPWVNTFETVLPRWGDIPATETRKGLQLMAGSSCKQLIALSECNAQLQRDLLEGQFHDMAADILPKITVIHPAQKPLIQSLDEKKLDPNRITMAFVGTDFYRKGGAELLRVMDLLLREGLPLKLVIVSKMTFGDWASKTTAADHEASMKLIHRHPTAIVQHSSLPYTQVLEVFRDAHIGVLPTWADSYGYSVLEAQASGCAVISTDLRALPEINSPDRGWLLSMPKNEMRNGRIQSEEDRKAFRKSLEEQLEQTLRTLVANPESIRTKAERSLQYIREHHSPESRASLTEAIYDKALGTRT